jgi:transposase
MTSMDQIHRIRQLYFEQGKNMTEIAEIEHLDWRTVRKYVDKDDFNSPPPKPASSTKQASKLDPYKAIIDQWLQEDKHAPRKQRHTAKRVYDRLTKEVDKFDCCYRLVADYVRRKKKEMEFTTHSEGFLPLDHSPGEAQGDFGTADFYENGQLHKKAKYFVLSFPYSNGGFLQLNYGENLECLLESMVSIFEYIGGVPSEIWFDNTSTIVTDIIKDGTRNVTERFLRFCEHYRFTAVFMNPGAGWEKGNVENKVGYLRRNELVPVPHIENLAEANRKLLECCSDDMLREHYDDTSGRTIHELFQEDLKGLHPLPSVPFDTAKYISASTDKYGKFTMERGKYRYSVSPDFSSTQVRLKVTSTEVIVMDQDMNEIIRHRRLYGDEFERMDWVPYLKCIARKPRSLKNSGLYGMMPENMQKFMDDCDIKNRGSVLKLLAELTARTGFDSAVQSVDEAIRLKVTDPDSLKNLYRRIFTDVPPLPPLSEDAVIPPQPVIPMRDDLEKLDVVLEHGGR